jgi:hypothetical protein
MESCAQEFRSSWVLGADGVAKKINQSFHLSFSPRQVSRFGPVRCKACLRRKASRLGFGVTLAFGATSARRAMHQYGCHMTANAVQIDIPNLLAVMHVRGGYCSRIAKCPLLALHSLLF